MVRQALSDEIFALIADYWLLGENDLSRIQNCLVSNDRHLGLIVSEWLLPE
jgi:hypothetical protein